MHQSIARILQRNPDDGDVTAEGLSGCGVAVDGLTWILCVPSRTGHGASAAAGGVRGSSRQQQY